MVVYTYIDTVSYVTGIFISMCRIVVAFYFVVHSYAICLFFFLSYSSTPVDTMVGLSSCCSMHLAGREI